MIKKLALSLLVFLVLFLTSAATVVLADDGDSCHSWPGYERVAISGTGVHDFNTVIVHRSKQTGSGKREITTDTIELWGDVEGRVLYQPRSVYDFVKGTLVNTGHQVFSGTVHGSRPVMLHDDAFRFEVDLNTGMVHGEVYLTQHISGPRTSCELTVTGDGNPPVDNRSSFTYEGVCWMKKGR